MRRDTISFMHRERTRDWPLLHRVGDSVHITACGRRLKAPIYRDLTASEYTTIMYKTYGRGFTPCPRCVIPDIVQSWREM